MNEDNFNRELNALLRLLDDPDKKIISHVESKIMAYGREAVPVLQDCWENMVDPVVNEKIEKLIFDINFKDNIKALDDWKNRDQHDLLKGYLIISQYEYPEFITESLIKEIEKKKNLIWLELNDQLTAFEKTKVINHFFYEVFKFKTSKNPVSPMDYYLNHLLETRMGNHLSLGILYLIFSSMLDLPVFGVNLPDHFVLGFARKPINHELDFKLDNEVLFYINPSKKGVVFTQNEIKLYLEQTNISPDDLYFYPNNNLLILQRLLNELVHQYQKSGKKKKAEDMAMMLKTLER